ncbi:MAG: class I SAM-dependent methyltransferase [Rhodothermaceae bacterium]
MRLITFDDLIDTYSKFAQRGGNYLLSKFTLNKKSRTKSAFDSSASLSSNWWDIPLIKERQNKLMTGSSEVNFREYYIEKYLSGKSDLKLLSLGSGSCFNELDFARSGKFSEVVCLDITEDGLREGKETAQKENLTNIQFICDDLYNRSFQLEYFDVVLFSNSLHHFDKVNELLSGQVKSYLKSGGHLVMDEFVGPTRLQFPKHQIKAINESLKLIDERYRKRYKTDIVKNKYYGSGWLRMLVADPSECIDSVNILPAVHKNFETVEENFYGGNILMCALKDIAHHFIELNETKKKILTDLFNFEDEYLKKYQSDLVFGVYRKE